MTSFIENESVVSMSYSLKSDTVRQEEKKRDIQKDNKETKSLKALVKAILEQDKLKDNFDTSIKKHETKPQENNAFCLTLRTDLKCRRCFNWGGGIARQGLCLLTKEKKSHVDNCMDYHDTAGGVYAHSRRH